MSVVDWLRDLFGRHTLDPPPSTEAQRHADAVFENMQRERSELAEARRVVGRWGDPIAEGLTRQLGVPVVFEPDHRDVEAVRDVLYPPPGTMSR